MQIYEELKARGLIAQVTDEEEIRDVINNGKATFYIGFDCTADSLTAADRLTSDTICAPHINENLYIPVTTASKRHNQNNNPKPRHRLIN